MRAKISQWKSTFQELVVIDSRISKVPYKLMYLPETETVPTSGSEKDSSYVQQAFSH